MKRCSLLLSLALLLLLPAGSFAASGLPWETFYVTGASHIDLAWKWHFSEGEQVAHFTYKQTLDMMDEYADETGGNPVYYTQSNAQTYIWMEQDYPDVFARIKQRVAEGRWELVGGMWTESDAELPSGESFCRQFLEAQWYFYDKFGKMAKIGWLPDSFGFNANLPQFMKRAGIDRFFFFKLNWNDTNPPDWNLCHWIGPDGSDVQTHLAYAQYNNDGWVSSINGAVDTKRAQEPDQKSIFYPLGMGDHGGGITRFYLNQMLAHRDAGYNIHFGTAEDYFNSVNWDNVPRRIQDEMYLERHRGTATSRAEHKKNMRELEYKLQNAEIFSSLATLLGKADYPFAQLKDAWRRLLRDQFHDVMAGSAIDAVYKEDVAQNLAQVRATGDQALNDAFDFIAGNIDIPDGASPLLIFNPNNFAVTEPVIVAGATAQQSIVDAAGASVPCQFSATDGGLVFLATDVPAWGWALYRLADGAPSGESAFPADSRHLQNEHLRLTLDNAGFVTSIFNKDLQKEFIAAGQRANALQLYPDFPGTFDAWDIGFDKYTTAPSVVTDLQSAALVENGPVRQVIEIKRNGAKETYVQRVMLYAGADSADFDTLVQNWGNPAHRFLKVAFPTAIANPAKSVRHNIPYGSLTRVLDGHRADTEFHGHKWVDLVETRTGGGAPTMGLALINREKYGYDVANDGPGNGLSDGKCNILRLSLLKSGTSPCCKLIEFGGPVTDIGDFMTHYRVYPHGGAMPIDDVYRRGESFANPLLVHAATPHTGNLPVVGKLLSIAAAGGNAIATTLKWPERDAASRELVLRLVEMDGADTTAKFDYSAFDIVSTTAADNLERPEAGAAEDYFAAAMPLGAHAIQTYRVVFGAQTPADDDTTAEPDDDNDTQPPAPAKSSGGHGACCGG